MGKCESNIRNSIDAATCEAIKYSIPREQAVPLQEETKQMLDQERQVLDKIGKTQRSIGQEEWVFLVSYFHLSWESVQTVQDIIRLQQQLNFSWKDLDGVIGPKTLEAIYLQYYSQDISSLPNLQRTRWEVYQEMKDYPPKKRWVQHLNKRVTLYASSLPKVFSKDYYFWETPWTPLNGGWINTELLDYVDSRIDRQDPITFMKRLPSGKYILTSYISGELVFASYTSPGNPNIPEGELTPEWLYSGDREWQFADKYWISWSSSSVRQRNGRLISAIMPYAVNENGWIFAHAWATNGERRSHGCMRLPLHYAKIFYEIYKSQWRMSWQIEAS